MADLKISQLTSATTPLSGTEVLPIVQSGTTKQVSVADLTAGRDVAAKSATLTQTTVGSGGFKIAAEVLATDYPATRFLNTTANDGFLLGWDTDHVAIATNTTSGLAGTERVAIYKTSGDVKLNTGNLIQGTADKGVNFTANTPAAGMTSQLLNWYEEGTWTPVLLFGGASTGITGTFTGTYTRIGNLVMVRGHCSVTNKGSATGAANINGLPFPVKSNTQPFASGSIYVSGGAIAAGSGEMVQLNFNASGIDVNKVNPATGADANCTDGNFATSGSFWFSAVYDV